MDDKKNIFPAEISGTMRGRGEFPAVGDWVHGTHQPGEWIHITELKTRRTCLQRQDPNGKRAQVLAANVDVLFIVTSANQDLNLNRLDRYVAMALSGNIQPVIVINKMELSENPQQTVDEVAERFSLVDVHGVSVFENWNLDALKTYAAPGKTVAFAGSSGVGKSSLTNWLLGSERMATHEIRGQDGRGRHTTTHRELHLTAEGAVLIDAPGLRSLALTDDEGVSSLFSDIEELTNLCRFNDCSHSSEPGCAVMNALHSGELASERWESFNKLQRELAYEKRRVDKALQSVEKKRWAKITNQFNVNVRKHLAMKGRR